MDLLPVTHLTCIILLSGLFLFSCTQTETIVVEEGPKVAVDTVETEQDSFREFRMITVGEHDAINSLDPLFADDASSMRVVQLMYEGLVRFNDRGEIIPAVAQSWEVGDDSLTYRFTLRPDVYYHESSAFSAGAGRKLVADDIKFVFERMARNNVPPAAAQLFMSVSGFEPFYREQRNIYLPADRELQEISGITVPNDSTVVFELIEQDDDFLKKLATPPAVIYPPEAVGSSPGEFTPVGTGPFRFSQQNDDTYIFSKFREYYDSEKINLNRIDIRLFSDESNLFKAFAAGDVQLLPQLGPQVISSIIDEDGTLSSSYAGRFRLDAHSGQTKYTLHYNYDSELPESLAKSLAGEIYSSTDTLFRDLPEDYFSIETTVDSAGALKDYNRPVYTTYSEDPYIKMFYNNLMKIISSAGLELQMVKIRTPSNTTGLYVTVEYPIMEVQQFTPESELASFTVRHLTLRQPGIDNLSFNQFPWWIDLRETNVPQTTTQK